MRIAREFKNPALVRHIKTADEAALCDALLPDPDAPGWSTSEIRSLVQEGLNDPRPSIDGEEVFARLRTLYMAQEA